MDPTLLHPIVALLGDDAEFPGQVGDPPFVLTDEVGAEQFSDEAKFTYQRPDRSRGEHAATTRGNETLGVESRGDLRQVKSLLMEFLDPSREASKILQLLISADRPRDLMVCRDATVPNDRLLVELGRLVGHDDDPLHDAAHDLLAIHCRRPRSLPERGDAVRKGSDSLAIGFAQRRRQSCEKPVVILLRLTLLLQRVLPPCLECPPPQSFFGLHGVILPLGPLDLMTRAFPRLTPMVVKAPALSLGVLDGAQAEVQRSGLQRAEHFSCYQLVQSYRR